MRKQVKILGVPLDRVTLKECGEITKKLIKISNKSCKIIVAPNVEFVMTAQRDKEFKEILQHSELATPDSVGIMWAAKRYKAPISERIPGQAYFRKVIEIAEKEGWTIYLLGGMQGIPELTRENLLKIYPNVKIIGLHHGYFNNEEEKEVIEEINKLQPNVLFVALGAPKQEKWIYRNKDILKVDVAAGQGGTFDYEAGRIARAPKIIQKMGIEWLYRLVRQPKRIWRMRVLPVFVLKVLFDKK